MILKTGLSTRLQGITASSVCRTPSEVSPSWPFSSPAPQEAIPPSGGHRSQPAGREQKGTLLSCAVVYSTCTHCTTECPLCNTVFGWKAEFWNIVRKFANYFVSLDKKLRLFCTLPFFPSCGTIRVNLSGCLLVKNAEALHDTGGHIWISLVMRRMSCWKFLT